MKQIDQMRRRAARYLDVEAVEIAPATGVFSLSFDDFPATAWTEAGPILAAHGVRATYYVCGGLADGVNMDRDQYRVEHLQALHAAGHEVGCHTFGHTSALKMDAEALRLSLDANAAWVAERLDGHRMTTFAWPFGDATVGAKGVVRRRFALARGVRDGVNAGREDRALIKSIGLESRRLPGYDLEALMAEAAERRGWLTAYGHDVSDRPTDYGCTPADLDHVLRAAKAAGLEIAPVGEAWGAVTRA
ncbi:MAG: polysaccharide deacetylase family protein [Brevundimonas sp.]|uniref:polysaccharide deacetylase family protein n=1 Tax=Brevundimonas sp. TaxID=1871086 RepID=UPI0027172C00|nr:polysaccharide deacetylase family protein [Brevundimonas sp.]MDZ4319959.1 polysaccharide deacetylase family protein [Phenylobacterium sp.]MDO9586460.1 polysaccharide deacetylase family protein [Brevundimonas sp.]MDP3368575.1 polysaccharide deacetylase family protein [Brevundimonas sp.]MDP3655706.1 polysaccharide deacetylase family protein [Brevundimonas sp.]MDZ4108562.1 polysaccharide deacetylase family protein [Brevundimonas sp.]